MRRIVVPVGLVLAATFVVVPGGRAEAVETCQGRAATLVGTGSDPMTGTEGPDVVVSNGSDVYTGGGSDTICVTGGGSPTIDAGPGADEIVVTTTTYDDTVLRPGPGDDRVVGGPGPDRLVVLEDDDLVDLGAGDDVVEVTDHSRVTRGLVGGPGADLLLGVVGLYTSTTSDTVVDLDLVARSLTRDGVALATGFADFERYGFSEDLDLGVVRAATSVTGSAAAETVFLDSVFRYEVDLAGGGDTVELGFPHSGVVRGGPGRDRITARGASFGGFEIDLRVGLFRRNGRTEQVSFSGFEDATATSRHAVVRGNAAPNRLSGACGRLVGGRGDDRLVVASEECGPARVEGGFGDDVLIGGPGSDTLVGGPGRDRADGRGKSDRCSAERRVRCER